MNKIWVVTKRLKTMKKSPALNTHRSFPFITITLLLFSEPWCHFCLCVCVMLSCVILNRWFMLNVQMI